MVTIRLENLGARYGQRTVIHGVTTAAFVGGQVVAVVGPNAAGKSTLFKRMAGLIDGPGQVVLEGSKKGPQGISYMPQGLNASARLTVYESVLLARKQLTPGWVVHDDELKRVDDILAALGITELSFRNLGELSGGQQQLVSIAQTLVREPEILLMDEPTSALDMHRQVQVLGFMRALARKREVIVFIAIHDLNQALRFADQVLVVADGTAQGSGPSAEVITESMLRKVYKVEARIERCSRGQHHILIDDIV
ncbi:MULTISPECIES: ABC transporter ATP-binding protein [unclassified Pseudomonas]|uniref:ABC transporter ATP-binding protein n=1 Tax=unclassified Pseudomonas TaxID=196821 RepID=UPI000871217D|nr:MULTISPECIES: ABC transporter ATP-binding protein [unclassified Pseudomonas]SCW33627.1 iron complex transport system ATP-binding protein [Pseudomonas sp. NFACC05-1]SCZ20040.1 iron complex transport system ATP-binding protein [Pseudomonas sp. NFACC44-2]SDA45114.1 iron complex transport system ATP-binding protein [Pseudomonas sp. NFACC51]SFH06684.1 iron complex transport system ATP-binding protein [Pseudomonas sp. NFACC54]SFS40984.1 iron complex transport system ATP-binding protein [Pseudomon